MEWDTALENIRWLGVYMILYRQSSGAVKKSNDYPLNLKHAS
jgi:hypothetical protein